MKIDQKEDMYIIFKANNIKNGKSFSIMQEQLAGKVYKRKTLQGQPLSKSEEKTIQQEPNECLSMQLVSKDFLQAVTPTHYRKQPKTMLNL